MKQILFTNWHLMRWIRLVFAIFLITQAIAIQQWILLFFSLFFIVQVVFNLGCGACGCSIPTKKNNNE